MVQKLAEVFMDRNNRPGYRYCIYQASQRKQEENRKMLLTFS